MKKSNATSSEPASIRIIVRHGSGEKVIIAPAGTRLLDALQETEISLHSVCGGSGTCAKCLVDIEGQGLVRACRHLLEREIRVTMPMSAHPQILESGSGVVKQVVCDSGIAMTASAGIETISCDGRVIARRDAHSGEASVPYGVAIDIGTTTVVAYLEDLSDGRTIAVESFVNPQAGAGGDVISRIHFVMERASGLAQLQRCLVSGINRAVEKARSAGKIDPWSICKIAAVGNPTMLHLLLAVDPSPIAQAPYAPAFTEAQTTSAAMLGLAVNPEAVVVTLPCISGYVGADVVAGIASTPMIDEETLSLYIDIGTNGEMALGNRECIFCCASAAGPAFEGSGICCGVGGVAGAICSYEHGTYATIGGCSPVGICGSGIVDIIAGFLDNGIVDARGFMESDVIIESAVNTGCGRDIVLTPADVREVQLAKAAIASGIEILIKQAGVGIDEVKRVYLAGAFGNFMNVGNAARIGMIPQLLAAQAVCVGNAAGTGARLALRSREFERSLKRIAGMATYVELSGRADFNATFVEAMNF
jgi:uncharacterized 2Fe-2S/4Fe-4S cluster protein (DUF4445 family)